MAGKIIVALAIALLAFHASAATETISGLGGTCKYALKAEVNTTHAVIRANGSTSNTKCGVQNPEFESFFANDSVLTQTIYKGNTPVEASLTVTPGQVSSLAALDGGACLLIPANVSGSAHICQFRYLNTQYHLALLTTKPDGGDFDGNVTEFLEPAVNVSDVLFTVQQSGTNSSTTISDQAAHVILSTNGTVPATLAGLNLFKAIIKTKYVPGYKVVDFEEASIKPFAAPVANTTNNTFDTGFTFETIVKGTESTCFLTGCELTLLLIDPSNNRLAVVKTQGFETTDWALTGLAIGVIIAIIIGVLILCSCLCGIVYFCRRKSGEHQPLREH